LERAAATLERALRIDPQDPYSWHRLASLRLRQDRPAQAEALARKSNLLAGEDPALRARNWKIVAVALRETGDETGARIAEREAARAAP
jgi:Tfp pilus assembly protein PilF